MISAQEQVNSLQIANNNAQIQALNDQKVLINGVMTTIQSAFSTWNSMSISLTNSLNGIQWNSSLSPNTPQQTYQQESAYNTQLINKVEGETMSSPTYSTDVQQLQAFSQTFLATSKAYNGISQQYLNDYENETTVLSGLQTTAQSQVETLGQQLIVQDQQLNALNAQNDSLNLANTNLALIANNVDALGKDLSATVNALAINTNPNQNTPASSGEDVTVGTGAGPSGNTGQADGSTPSGSTGVSNAGGQSVNASNVGSVASSMALGTFTGDSDNQASTGYDLSGGATGGVIVGGIPGKDSVLSLLMPGEVVYSTKHVSMLEQAAQAMQSHHADWYGESGAHASVTAGVPGGEGWPGYVQSRSGAQNADNADMRTIFDPRLHGEMARNTQVTQAGLQNVVAAVLAASKQNQSRKSGASPRTQFVPWRAQS